MAIGTGVREAGRANGGAGPGSYGWSAAKDPFRLALVGPLPPPNGGMANQTRQLARLWQGEGMEVELVQVNAPYRPAWVGRVRLVRAANRLVPFLVKLWSAAGRADVVHVMANSGWSWHLFAAPAVRIAALRGVPSVVNYRGGGAEAFLIRSHAAVRSTLRRAAALVVPSSFLKDVFEQKGFRPQVVPNIIDLNRFRPLSGDSHCGGGEGLPRTQGPHFVVTRNLESVYDVGTAIRAFRRIVDEYRGCRLTVAGSGSQREALLALAADLGVSNQVTFTGRLDNDRIADLYRTAEVALNASLVDNMPISILEALATGIPIVTTAVGGIPMIVEDGVTALLVPPGDPAAMAEAALRLLRDPGLARRLREAGREVARQYAWDRVRDQWLEVYRECRERLVRPGSTAHSHGA